MAYNENPNPENLRLRELEILEKEMREERREWFNTHLTHIYIVIGILVAALVVIGIHAYNDSKNPMARFVGSSAKNLGSSFSFEVTADKNGETVMSYSGAMKADTGLQSVAIAYDAEYTDYSYSNVIYTNGAITYKGNLYNGQWTLSDSSKQVQEFYDFYNDYRKGSFDGGAFVRFTGLNNTIYSRELENFMKIAKSRLSAESSVAAITTERENGSITFTYQVDLQAVFDLISERGASVFYTLPDYNNFVNRVKINKNNIAKSSCTLSFTVNPDGYMSHLSLVIGTADDEFSLNCVMSDFGKAVPQIPDEFYTVAGIQKPSV